MTAKEKLKIKLEVAEEYFKKAEEEHKNLAETTNSYARGIIYANYKYYQGVVETCKFALELLEGGE